MKKIAAITITYNDGYKLKEWHQWYEEYKDEVYLHIIVDNGSDINYLNEVKSMFPKSHIICLGYNGGCTGAYNAGIKYALENKSITHIALIGNDIRLEHGALSACVDSLDDDKDLGMLAPILLEANSNIVADFGCNISNVLTMIPFGIGKEISEISETKRYCDAVTGGMNISKREFYEQIGLQDEKLFMYSDEVDMGLRAKLCGVRLGVTKDAKSWHQHVNPNGTTRRLPFSSYLIGRNKVYLARKHFGFFRAIYVFAMFVVNVVKGYVKCILRMQFERTKDYNWMFLGAIKGLFNDMRPNKFSSL